MRKWKLDKARTSFYGIAAMTYAKLVVSLNAFPCLNLAAARSAGVQIVQNPSLIATARLLGRVDARVVKL